MPEHSPRIHMKKGLPINGGLNYQINLALLVLLLALLVGHGAGSLAGALAGSLAFAAAAVLEALSHIAGVQSLNAVSYTHLPVLTAINVEPAAAPRDDVVTFS